MSREKPSSHQIKIITHCEVKVLGKLGTLIQGIRLFVKVVLRVTGSGDLTKTFFIMRIESLVKWKMYPAGSHASAAAAEAEIAAVYNHYYVFATKFASWNEWGKW
ncbi:hypothetical protein L3X38_034970 [Prunus dulcis]|uniref:Uncharacterized protein n=1 Tax=Prunus dulcis TaxID=3755 RepID=A0AAD4YY80_PRUDU|nr:hypothetical protein L3X38_034970 [Prunus dulcis]